MNVKWLAWSLAWGLLLSPGFVSCDPQYRSLVYTNVQFGKISFTWDRMI